MKPKAFAYIVNARRLLLFTHADFPEAGIQVPAGSIRENESSNDAVLREANEETGLAGLQIVQKIGIAQFVVTHLDSGEIHERHYYQLRTTQPVEERWRAYENDPSDGGDPIAFDFFWAPLEDLPPLIAGHDQMVPVLLTLLERYARR